MSEILKNRENVESESTENSKKFSLENLKDLGLFTKRDGAYEIPLEVMESIRKEVKNFKAKLGTKTFKNSYKTVMEGIYAHLGKEYLKQTERDFSKEESLLNELISKERLIQSDIDNRDELTQLYNRDQLLDFITGVLLEKEGADERLLSLNIDIDYFKSYNDAFGHIFGNLALESVSEEMIDHGRADENKVDARVGGEELTEAVLLAGGREDTEQYVKLLASRIASRGDNLFKYLALKMGDKFDVKRAMFEVLADSRAPEIDKELSQNHKEVIEDVLSKLEKLNINIKKNKTPAEIYEQIGVLAESAKEGVGKDNLLELQKSIIGALPIGGATLGYIEIDLSNNDAEISPEDKEYIDLSINGEKPYLRLDSYKDVLKELVDPDSGDLNEGVTYFQIKQLVQDRIKALEHSMVLQSDDNQFSTANASLINEKTNWQLFINDIYKRRAGRIIDACNNVQEAQKDCERAVVGKLDNRLTMDQLDSGDVGILIEKKYERGKAEGKSHKMQFSQETSDTLKRRYQGLEKTALLRMRMMNRKAIDPRLALFNRWKSFSREKAKKESIELPGYFDSLVDGISITMERSQESRYFDHLTRSYNERYLLDVQQKQMQRVVSRNQNLRESGKPEAQESYTFVSLDMDNLKAINETGGHKLGDVVLMKFAEICQEFLGKIQAEGYDGKKNIETSFIRVTGGEEFAMIFNGLDSLQVKDLLAELQAEVGAKIKPFLESIKDDSGKSVWQAAQEYVKEVLGREGDDGLDKIATFTAGIIDVKDIEDEILVDKNGKAQIGIMRQITDQLGEKQKEGSSRGTESRLFDLGHAVG